MSADGGRTALAGVTAQDPEGRPEGRHRMDVGGFFELPDGRAAPFAELLMHASVRPYLDGILGEGYRLDHGPGVIAMEPGTEGGTLHGGGFDSPSCRPCPAPPTHPPTLMRCFSRTFNNVERAESVR